MFSFSLGSGGTPTSLDPEEERKAPPEPTLIYFPQNDIDVHSSDEWSARPPDLFKEFGRLAKPADIRLSHLNTLNVNIENDVPLEQFVPINPSGPAFLPPSQWTQNLDPLARRSSVAPSMQDGAERHFLLSNGTRAPGIEAFTKNCRELACSTEDGLRAIGHRKPRKGHVAPHLNHYRDFWQKLEAISQYWDTVHDHYYQIDSESAANSRTTSPTASPKVAFKRLSIFSSDRHGNNHDSKKHSDSGRRYKGFRKSTGSKMPESYRIDMVRFFIRNIVMSFHCTAQVPRAAPKLEITKLCIPVTQNFIVYRLPEDKKATQRGIVEGPLLGVQCRNETAYARSDHLATLDVAREIAGLLMLAQERAREGKPRRIPGEGKWYTTKPRWGGGPGGEFGEAEGNTDAHPTVVTVRTGPGHLPKKMTEEQIWKELKPGQGLWDWRTTYLAVGKDRTQPLDSVRNGESVVFFDQNQLTMSRQVFMISSIFHHISIIRMDVDPLYLDYTISGIPGEKPQNIQPGRAWSKPKIYRTKWYDMLEAADRVECFRGMWGVMSYLMRSDQTPTRPSSQRQNSAIGPLFSSHKTANDYGGAELSHQRSQSVAF